MSSTRAAIAMMAIFCACTPPLDPPWLITRARELALEVEVVAQGPYGEPIVASSRSPRDALPLDTLRLEPVVVDADGVIDPDELEGAWFLCSDFFQCLGGTPLRQRPRCPDDEIRPAEPCRLADGGRTLLTLGDFPSDLDADNATIFDLLVGPAVTFIASGPEGPGLESCLERIESRTHLGGCLIMMRVIRIGPLDGLRMQLEALGIDPGLDEDAQTLLARPRNRNPAVEEIIVRYGEQSQTVAAGARVSVPAGEELELVVVTTEEDTQAYEVELGEETITFSDQLGTEWWFDQEVDREEFTGGELSVRVGTDGITEFRAYVVLRDDRGGEGWGWVDLEVGR